MPRCGTYLCRVKKAALTLIQMKRIGYQPTYRILCQSGEISYFPTMNSPETPNKPSEGPNEDRRPSPFAQYSGIGLQMLATIGIGVYSGMRLDQWQGNKIPGWTIGLSLFAIASSLYLFIKQLPKN